MSISEIGLKSKLFSGKIAIEVEEDHPLKKLGNALDWCLLYEIIAEDLKRTEKGLWYVGRKLKVRTHLGVYILQQMMNKKDRQMEREIKDNAAYQIFCGYGIVKDFKVPDHTKIEDFRSRLRSETQQRLANEIVVLARKYGYARVEETDFDSTVQKANISYPSDVHLLGKLSRQAMKIQKKFCPGLPEVNFKEIKSLIRSCFFKGKKASKEVKRELQEKLWTKVSEAILPIIDLCEQTKEKLKVGADFYTRRAIDQVENFGRRILRESKVFFEKGRAVKNKLLSLHSQAVSCFNKNKLGQVLEFGRNFQLGRVGGNFMIVGKCENVRQEDKKSVGLMLALHEELFGEDALESIGLDKGYYSEKNAELLKGKKIKEIGLQKPNCGAAKTKDVELSEMQKKLVNRRAGIEPLIGHIKRGGQLEKSRMKFDTSTESAGYSAVLGFNLRQFMRHQAQNEKMQALAA